MTRPSRLLVASLLEMPAYLEATYACLPDRLLRLQPANDRSPLIEHLWHVRDCESDLYGPRLRRTLSEHEPFLEPMAVAHWPRERRYTERAVQPALAQFGALRRDLADLLSACTDEQLRRRALRADDRVSTVLDLVDDLLEHDRDHRVRIAAVVAAFHQGDEAQQHSEVNRQVERDRDSSVPRGPGTRLNNPG